jgi:hypothetical protein
MRQVRHALSVAISINDIGRVERLRDAIIALEDAVAIDDKLGLWGYSFDLLIENKRVLVADEIRSRIVSDLEARLDRVTDAAAPSAGGPWAAQAAA